MKEMTKERAISLLNGDPKSVGTWNDWWRKRSWKDRFDLSRADLRRANLSNAHLESVNLDGANLYRSDCSDASFVHAVLDKAHLVRVDFSDAALMGASLMGAELHGATFRSTEFEEADFRDAVLYWTQFADTDLSCAINLEAVVHRAPSSVDSHTLVHSAGKIPAQFLQGCGLRPWEILQAKLYNPDLTPAQVNDLQYKIFDARTSGPIIIGGVFISYSHTDSAFVDKVRSKLLEKGVSVWLDRHDSVAGPLQKQIDLAIGANNAVLLVLSEDSVESDWVEHEMKAARRIEKAEERELLCPVALDEAWKEKQYEVEWEHMTKKKILDFSKWKTKAFGGQFEKLLKGLKIYYTPRPNDTNGNAPIAL